MVYSNYECSSAFCLSMTFCSLLRMAWWPSTGKELSSWLSALAVLILCSLNCLCSFPIWCPGQDVDFSSYRFLIVAYSSTFQIIETDRGTPNTPCVELDSCLIEKVSNLPFVPGASQPDVKSNNNKH